MTSLTVLTVLVMVYGFAAKAGYGYALALGGATAAGAAFVFAGIAVPTFYAVSVGCVLALLIRIFATGKIGYLDSAGRLPPGVLSLALLLFWSVLVTFIAPLIFDGLPVVLPTGKGAELVAGVITSSNFAQIVYLVLGISVVLYLARSQKAGPTLIGTAVGLTILLSTWRYSSVELSVPFPEKFFDNSPYFKFIETAPGGIPRFRGILSEPAALAGASLVAICYMVPQSFQVKGLRRMGCLSIAGVAAYLGVVSTSTTFIVAGVIILLVAAIAVCLRFLILRQTVTTVASLLLCLGVIVGMFVVPVIAEFVRTAVDDKVGSSSFDDRTAANSAAYEIFISTFGMGAGLGSTRASSFFAGTLGTTGLIGTLLLIAAVVELISKAARSRSYRPVIWALVASIVLKVVSGPDLSDSSGIFWIALGLLSKAAAEDSHRSSSELIVSTDSRSRRHIPDRLRSSAGDRDRFRLKEDKHHPLA